MNKIFGLIFVSLIVGFACTNNTQEQQDNSKESIETNVVEFNASDYKMEDIVFYNLFSPVDLSYLLTKDVSFYNSSLLNPLNNITNYNESVKAALNLGVYGADISYLWLFNQSQQANSYLIAIQVLSDQLGIPRDFVDFTINDAENHVNNLDTLISIARESYYTAEVYLKDSGREHTASLILFGGWIETLYIAINMYDRPDERIVSRVASQKFSANSLFKLMQMSQNKISVSEYFLLIKKMNNLFEEMEIKFPSESLVIDTSKRKIFVAEGALINLSDEQIEQIRTLTKQIRTHIIE